MVGSQFIKRGFTCSKLTKETQEQGVKYLLSLLLNLNIFHTSF